MTRYFDIRGADAVELKEALASVLADHLAGLEKRVSDVIVDTYNDGRDEVITSVYNEVILPEFKLEELLSALDLAGWDLKRKKTLERSTINRRPRIKKLAGG